jgi:hypothetical protein
MLVVLVNRFLFYIQKILFARGEAKQRKARFEEIRFVKILVNFDENLRYLKIGTILPNIY